VSPNRRLLVPVAGVVALLGLAMLAAAFGNPAVDVVPLDQRPLPTAGGDLNDEAQAGDEDLVPESEAPSGLPGAPLLAGCGVVVLLVIVGAGWWFSRTSPAPVRFTRIRPVIAGPDPDQARRLRAAIDEGLNELAETDADPRRAVIACWVRLERAAAAAGTGREPGDTSSDLVGRVLARHQVSREMLATLAALYREARFAPHDVPPATRDQARAALRQIRDELGAAPTGGPR
jgi:Domain of unknown function (DUF4129)